MKYKWILFDADETLFHFDAFSGLKLMLSRKGVEFSESDYQDYKALNKPLWDRYQQGTITAHEIKLTRFDAWAKKLNTTALELNVSFLQAMADISTMLPGAKELIESLAGKVKLGIITNGFSDLQFVRLEKHGLDDHFEHVVISEEVGVAKPDRKIFEFAMNKMGQPDKKQVLMVGDNLHSDILGGRDYGFDTCWLNSEGKNADGEITPNYTVRSLTDLRNLLVD
ncbi:pyrimidine 5'-nucleotidase [Vibrio sp. S4M6]|uniref:pyrimidine 5'-nucleotidase n=1 Tax=Vibrio sinus TaxID=2946865 RepID=UPI002029EB92|nr:pyrimidine 5'-nucleotidase [Vibrio sinus]MCL9780842.1 pyrimidine 5'-nucleotidase [Vibrio sinus]